MLIVAEGECKKKRFNKFNQIMTQRTYSATQLNRSKFLQVEVLNDQVRPTARSSKVATGGNKWQQVAT